jgi:hypothetical protein
LQQHGDVIALLVVAAALAAFADIFLAKGIGYGGQPLRRITRAEDPFTFWLWVGIPLAAALFLGATALATLLRT